MDFVHLHGHSDGSLQDGLPNPKGIIKKAFNLGQNAVAITDHGSLCNTIKFSQAAKEPFDKPKKPKNKTKKEVINYKKDLINYLKYNKSGVKPIIGIELYYCDNCHERDKDDKTSHIIFLVKNEIGYKNLVKMTTYAHMHGFYYNPRVDMNVIKKYSEGLICLTACMKGVVCDALVNEGQEKAEKVLCELKEIFQEDLYVELMFHGISEETKLMLEMEKMAISYGIDIVATNDYHYLSKQDYKAQRVLNAIQTHNTLSTLNIGMTKNEFYMKSAEEMKDIFDKYLGKDSTQYIENTQKVADKVDFKLNINNDVQFPEINIKENFDYKEFREWRKSHFINRPDDQAFLAYRVYMGLKEKSLLNKKYLDRAKEELKIIFNSGFTKYFLITQDYTQMARMSGIRVGPGRGSAAASLCCYALGITILDPIKTDLKFERFINIGRCSVYDFNFEELPISEWQNLQKDKDRV